MYVSGGGWVEWGFRVLLFCVGWYVVQDEIEWSDRVVGPAG